MTALMIELLILLLGVVLLILALGLPLLVKPDSLIPDILALAILSAFVLVFIWGTGGYWIILPILALVAFVAWLERSGQATPVRQSGAPHPPEGRRGAGEAGVSDRTLLRFRLWRTANHLGLVLAACALLGFATGSGIVPMTFIAGLLIVTLVASAGFRFSFIRSCRRDGHAPASRPVAP